MEKYQTLDTYIDSFPPDVQEKLKQIRSIVHEEAPKATEAISYGMPTFKLNGKNLVHFAGYHDHIGFYPVPSALMHLEKNWSRTAPEKEPSAFL